MCVQRSIIEKSENDPVSMPLSLPTGYLSTNPASQCLKQWHCGAVTIHELKEQDVEVNLGAWHMPLNTYFCPRYEYSRSNFPIVDPIFDCALTLPLHIFLTEREQETEVERLTCSIEVLT